MAKAYIASLMPRDTPFNVSDLPVDPDTFMPSSAARWTNGLWFMSLMISLVVSLLAILAKQWLEEYATRMRAHTASPRHWAWRHLVFNRGLTKYGLDAFISMLPVLLHLALFLFFAGLVIFLWELDIIIAKFILIASGAAFLIYVGTTLAPYWKADIPTVTPLHAYGRWIYHEAGAFLSRLRGRKPKVYQRLPSHHDAMFEGKDAEGDGDVLRTMVDTLPVTEEVDVALQAIGSLNPLSHPLPPKSEIASDEMPLHQLRGSGYLKAVVLDRLRSYIKFTEIPDGEETGRWMRTLFFVTDELPGAIANKQMRNLPTHDCALLVASTWPDWTKDLTPIVQQWSQTRGRLGGVIERPPFLPSTLVLLFAPGCDFRVHLTFLAVIFRCVTDNIMNTASDAPYDGAMDLLLDRAEDLLTRRSMCSPSQTEGVTYVPVQQHVSFRTRAISIWGYALTHCSDSKKRSGHSAIAGAFSAAAASFLEYAIFEFPRGEERCFEYVTTKNFLKIGWLPPVLVQLERLLTRSAKFTNFLRTEFQFEIMRSLLYKMLKTPFESELGYGYVTISSIKNRYGRTGCSSWAAALHDSHNPRSTLSTDPLGWLKRGEGELATSSAWRLINTIRHLSKEEMAELAYLAHELASKLCLLHRAGIDVSEEFDELTFGETEPMTDPDALFLATIRDQPKFFTASRTLLQHAKEINPTWWARVSNRLYNDTVTLHIVWDKIAEGWRPPVDLVREVDGLGPCQECLTQSGFN